MSNALKAELNRIEKELDTMDPDDPRFAEMDARANELLEILDRTKEKAEAEQERQRQLALESDRLAALLADDEPTSDEEPTEEEEEDDE